MRDIKSRVQSPCIRNCCLNDADVCLGCFRLLNEITRWSDADDTERQEILRKAKQRKIVHDAALSKWQA